MKHFLLALIAFSCSALGADNAMLTRQIKQKLLKEVAGLEDKLILAQTEVTQLKQAKSDIDSSFEALQVWGLKEQEDKLSYYNRTTELTQKLAETQAKVDQEKEKAKSTLLKYHRVRSLFAYVVGLALAFLYAQLGASHLAALLGTVVGPYGVILRYAGPVLVFGAGYASVLLFF
jgi:hypothetical protein